MKLAATIFLLAVGSTSLSADTILSVIGPTYIAFPAIISGQAVAIPFTVGQSYFDVSLSPDLINSFSGSAYLTSQIGVGTTLADQLATNSFTSTDSGSGSFRTVLQGVSITPGTYFLVLSTTEADSPGGWGGTISPTTVAAPGVSTPLGYYVSQTNGAYAPADIFDTSDSGLAPEIVISGNSTPEPGTWVFFVTAFGLFFLGRNLKRHPAHERGIHF